MASNESDNDIKVNAAISDVLRNGRGHSSLGKKITIPQAEGPGLPHRPRKEDPPPGYGMLWGPPNYDVKGKAPFTDEKPSVSEKPSAAEETTTTEKEPSTAEKALVTDSAPESLNKGSTSKTIPLYFLPKQQAKKAGPSGRAVTAAKYDDLMSSLGAVVKTKQEVEQGAKISDYEIAQRAGAHFVKKNLKLRYFHECSEQHLNEFKRLVAEGRTIDEACEVHSDFAAWMLTEKQLEQYRS